MLAAPALHPSLDHNAKQNDGVSAVRAPTRPLCDRLRAVKTQPRRAQPVETQLAYRVLAGSLGVGLLNDQPESLMQTPTPSSIDRYSMRGTFARTRS